MRSRKRRRLRTKLRLRSERQLHSNRTSSRCDDPERPGRAHRASLPSPGGAAPIQAAQSRTRQGVPTSRVRSECERPQSPSRTNVQHQTPDPRGYTPGERYVLPGFL